MIQIVCMSCIWSYSIRNNMFVMLKATRVDMLLARFLGSLFMHLNVEMHFRSGLNMMKYSLNHRSNFTNFYPAFLLGFLQCMITIMVETNCMVVLTTLPNIMEVIRKYVGLVSIGKLPEVYYQSID